MQASKAAGVLRITRTFPATRERVFEALTRPDLIAQWWGPAGFTLPKADLDLRVGGTYQFTMQPPQGEPTLLRGTFKEITRPSKIVYTWNWGDSTETETLVTIELEEAEGDTELVLTHEPFPNAEHVQQHDDGWQGGLDRLEEILKEERRGQS